MDKTRATVPPSARIQQLALLLIWEGSLSRSRLVSLFDLSPVRASEWIRELRGWRPKWTVWESRAKRYRATEAAYREWAGQSAQVVDGRDNGFARYLALTGLPPAELTVRREAVWTAFRDFSTPSPKIFACLRDAIERRQAVEIQYRSMREPQSHRRLVEPHSLIRAGRRWHVRAYSALDNDYRDYSLGRIANVALLDQVAAHDALGDRVWETTARVVIIAHPRLKAEQAEVVRFEYFQGAASRIENCRAALVPYLVQDLRAATDVDAQVPPDYQLAVGNVEEIRQWLFPR